MVAKKEMVAKKSTENEIRKAKNLKSAKRANGETSHFVDNIQLLGTATFRVDFLPSRKRK